jgi:hypothetical protein
MNLLSLNYNKTQYIQFRTTNILTIQLSISYNTVKLVQSGIAKDRIYFPHWPSFRTIQKKVKSIKIILHGTYLFISENQQRWLL